MGQFQQKKHSLLRNISSWIKAYFDRILSGKPRHLRVSTFCLIQHQTVKDMLAYAQTTRPLLSSLIFGVTRDVVGVSVSHSTRQEGKSGYSPLKMVRLFGRLLLNNASRFYAAFRWLGKGLLGLSLLGLLVLLTKAFLFQQEAAPWLFWGIGLLVSLGVFLWVVGTFGESLTHKKTKKAPARPYLIRQHLT
jgi:hypothetical protein